MMPITKPMLDPHSERRLWRILDDAAALVASADRQRQLVGLYMQALTTMRDFNIGGHIA